MDNTKAGSPYEGEPQESTAPDATAASGKNPGVAISQGTLTRIQGDVRRAIPAETLRVSDGTGQGGDDA